MPGKTDHRGPGDHGRSVASMRPQRNAGENKERYVKFYETPEASMRPQRNAGENMAIHHQQLPSLKSFNEAPAKCRGKPILVRTLSCTSFSLQ